MMPPTQVQVGCHTLDVRHLQGGQEGGVVCSENRLSKIHFRILFQQKKRSLIDGKSQKFGFYGFMICTGAPTPGRKTATTTTDINVQYNPFFLRKSGFGFSILKKAPQLAVKNISQKNLILKIKTIKTFYSVSTTSYHHC